MLTIACKSRTPLNRDTYIIDPTNVSSFGASSQVRQGFFFPERLRSSVCFECMHVNKPKKQKRSEETEEGWGQDCDETA